jgi:hypothetical protein
MSAEWGGIRADNRSVVRSEPEPESAAARRARVEAGAWSEDLRENHTRAGAYMTLPGKGEEGSKCGEWYPREFCAECGEPHFGMNRCMNRDCPECWLAWRRDRAVGITRRLSALRQLGDGIERRAVHAVFSPPEGEVTTLREVGDGFRDAYDLAREKGVRGGVAVFHGFRVKEDVKEAWRALDDAGRVEDGLWKWVREHERDWRDLTYWSPHYHVLGVCEDFEADDPDAQDGWVARRIRSMESHRLTDPDGYEDLAGAALYLLSHATYESGTAKDCVRWFGAASTATFQPESALSPGTLATVERYAEEACAAPVPDDEEGEGVGSEEEEEPCERCGADARQPIWDAGLALQDRAWCEEIGPEAQERLRVAFEWAIGEALPPPGLQRPTSEEEAREALEALM